MADIDVAMGGHVAEKLIIGCSKVTSGCGGDLQGATDMAYRAVRMFGMFGEKTGYISADPDATSEKYNAMVDKEVKEILDVRTQTFLITNIGFFQACLNFALKKGEGAEGAVQEPLPL